MHARSQEHSTSISVFSAHGYASHFPVMFCNMPTPDREADGPRFDNDVEERIENFKRFFLGAIFDWTLLLFLGGALWLSIDLFQSLSVPTPLRWAMVILSFFEITTKKSGLTRIFIRWRVSLFDEIESKNRLRNRNLGTRITDLEDWLLANVCAVVCLSTIGFVAWYWSQVIMLTIRGLFYWAIVMVGLCGLLWGCVRAMRFYRKVKRVQDERPLSIALIIICIFRLYYKFGGVFGYFFDAIDMLVDAIKGGFLLISISIGGGPLFGECTAMTIEGDV